MNIRQKQKAKECNKSKFNTYFLWKFFYSGMINSEKKLCRSCLVGTAYHLKGAEFESLYAKN